MNKYKLTGDLEDGAFASFHKGKRGRKEFLFKILKKKYYSLDECNGNKEVQILKRLDHKNVLKLIDVINDQDELLIVFENYTKNVKQAMKKRNLPFNEKETKDIMYQLLEGLDYIHRMSVMHRNLRLEALQCDDNVTVVKLADFSMATSTTSSQVGAYLVNPVYYVSPEVMLESGTYSSPVDIWAAGCIMAELMTGKPLLPGTSYADQMYKMAQLLGVFTKGEWPEGSMLQRHVGFSLPKSTMGEGLEKSMGMQVSRDAQDLILDMLVWKPEKRSTAKQCLRHDFFVGLDSMDQRDRDNADGNMDMDMAQTTDRLRSWQEKWKPGLDPSSLDEFEDILCSLTPRGPPGGSQMDNMGPSRQRSGMSQQNGGYGQTGSRGSIAGGLENSSLVQDSYSRHERRTSKAGYQSVGDSILQDDHLKAQKNNYNRANQPNQGSNPGGKRSGGSSYDFSNAFDPQNNKHMEEQFHTKSKNPDLVRTRDSDFHSNNPQGVPRARRNAEGDGSPNLEEEKRVEAVKEKMRKEHPIKFSDRHGNPFMRDLLGKRQSEEQGNEETIMDMKDQSHNKSNNSDRVRTRENDFHSNNPQGDPRARRTWDDHRKLDLNQSESNGNTETQSGYQSDTTRRRNLEIGEELNLREKKMEAAKIQRMKLENPIKYSDRHGNPFMRSLLGGRQSEIQEDEDPRQSDISRMSHADSAAPEQPARAPSLT